jgi:transcriptional regulator with XRE-family HTH domain
MESFGEKIKTIRKAKGISQTVVAESCGIKQSSYANIESGKTQNITIDTGKGIAKAIGVSFYELFKIDMSHDDFELARKLVTEKENLSKQNQLLLEKITEKEKIISLQDQVNQNFKNAIFEAFYYSSVKKSMELLHMIDNADLRNSVSEAFYSFTQEFLEKLKEWRCFTDAEIERYYAEKRKFIEHNIEIPGK